MDIEDYREFGIQECIGCGRCSYLCPVSHGKGDFSPRTVVERIAAGEDPLDAGIWSCTNCGLCSQACDSGVLFHQFVRRLRVDLGEVLPPQRTHGGIMGAIRGLNARSDLVPEKTNWVTDDLILGDDPLLFIGCLPYFHVLFRDFCPGLLDIPRSAVRLLNAMGLRPGVLPGERCCGHDAHWMGDEKTFRRLAEMNVRQMEGADEVIALCPEGYSTLRDVYPRFVGDLDFRVRGLVEVVAEGLEEGRLELERAGERIAFQDPCRLGRHGGIVEAPRRIMEDLGEVVEMPRSGEMSACCGHSNWVNCDSYTREWQLDRLREARRAGADALVTACPKCLIHLSCAQRGLEEGIIPVRDLFSLAASRLR
ncbi:MAG: (Fe-S)-binding protein [Methanomassiliicoccales archaeon]